MLQNFRHPTSFTHAVTQFRISHLYGKSATWTLIKHTHIKNFLNKTWKAIMGFIWSAQKWLAFTNISRYTLEKLSYTNRKPATEKFETKKKIKKDFFLKKKIKEALIDSQGSLFKAQELNKFGEREKLKDASSKFSSCCGKFCHCDLIGAAVVFHVLCVSGNWENGCSVSEVNKVRALSFRVFWDSEVRFHES